MFVYVKFNVNLISDNNFKNYQIHKITRNIFLNEEMQGAICFCGVPINCNYFCPR
jgi:hypothetical protein